jgi:hypothetical protein
MILSLQEGINALPEEGGSISEDIGIGLTEGFSKVFMLLFAAYGGVSVLAILVKIAHVGTHLCFFGLISALFDLAFTVLHGAVLIYVIAGGSLTVPIIALSALAFISLISFFVNTMSISN